MVNPHRSQELEAGSVVIAADIEEARQDCRRHCGAMVGVQLGVLHNVPTDAAALATLILRQSKR